MDFRESPARSHYREEVRDFLHAHTSTERIEEVWRSGTSHDPALHTAAAERGWIGATWPTRHGGANMHPLEHGALWEAMNYFRLPVDVWELTEMAAWVVLHRARDPLRQRVLAAVRAGRFLMALGYTEPDAGSDVAAARTTATRDGDNWIVNGAKIFTTGADVADAVLLLARTDLTAPKHRNLSMLLVELHRPGIEVQPIHTFGGERTNAVFFDNVAVPADALIGTMNEGWSALNIGLDFERSMMGTYVGRAQRVLDDLVAVLQQRDSLTQASVQAALAEANVRLAAARALCDDVSLNIASDAHFSTEAAMAKLAATEIFKDLAFLALDLAGPESLTDAVLAPRLATGALEHWFRHSQIATIYGGSNEIQRNIIAQHGLQLPRSN